MSNSKTHTEMKTYQLVTNDLHKELFANTWTYNSEILKRYSVAMKGINTVNGKTFSVGINQYPNAYTEEQAAEIAVNNYMAKGFKNCIITEVRATATLPIK